MCQFCLIEAVLPDFLMSRRVHTNKTTRFMSREVQFQWSMGFEVSSCFVTMKNCNNLEINSF